MARRCAPTGGAGRAGGHQGRTHPARARLGARRVAGLPAPGVRGLAAAAARRRDRAVPVPPARPRDAVGGVDGRAAALFDDGLVRMVGISNADIAADRRRPGDPRRRAGERAEPVLARLALLGRRAGALRGARAGLAAVEPVRRGVGGRLAGRRRRRRSRRWPGSSGSRSTGSRWPGTSRRPTSSSRSRGPRGPSRSSTPPPRPTSSSPRPAGPPERATAPPACPRVDHRLRGTATRGDGVSASRTTMVNGGVARRPQGRRRPQMRRRAGGCRAAGLDRVLMDDIASARSYTSRRPAAAGRHPRPAAPAPASRLAHGLYVSRAARHRACGRCRCWAGCCPPTPAYSHGTAASCSERRSTVPPAPHIALTPRRVLPQRGRAGRARVAGSRPEDLLEHLGLRVTAAAQTVLDLAPPSGGGELVAVGDALMRGRHLSAEGLGRRLERADRVRGVVRARACAPMLPAEGDVPDRRASCATGS